MIRNFLILTFRYLWRDKLGTFINILGFSTGLAAFFIIMAYVRHEMSYEKFNEKASRISRVNLELNVDGKQKIATVSPNILGPRLKEELPEVEDYTRIFGSFNLPAYFTIDGTTFSTNKFYFADSSIFNLFTIRMVKGSTKGLLTHKNELIVAESIARKFFGDLNVEGKMIKVNYKDDYIVKGVYADFPSTSQLHPEIIAPFMNGPMDQKLKWEGANFFTYILLNSPGSKDAVEKKMKDIVAKELPDYFKSTGMNFHLIPLLDIHLYSKADFEPEPVFDIRQVEIFSTIAIFILLLALVNYVNIATSKSLERAKEVALKKIMGSTRNLIIRQFLGESALLSFFSMVIALFLAFMSKPYVDEIFQRPVDFGFLFEPGFILLILALWIIMSLFAGLYPSIVLSMFHPAYVMKSSFKRSKKGSWMRKSLVIFQFIISSGIIIGTLVVYRQLSFMQNQKLGFDKEKILAISLVEDPSRKFDPNTFKKQLLQHAGIEGVSVASAYPTHNLGGQIAWGEGMQEKENMLIWGWEVDEDYIKTLGLDLISGKNLNPANIDPKNAEFIINETAMNQFGWTIDNFAGKNINMGYKQGICIGVMRDFHFTTLKSKIEPLMIFVGSDMSKSILVRITGKDVQGTIDYITGQWKSMASSVPVEYHFIDEQYNSLYKNEVNTGRFFMIFAVLAIIIACLGLFALSTYETQTRTKEIGIRKVLGSSELSIFNLLVRSFSLQVLISFIVAVPLSWYLMNNWLEGYAYRIKIEPVIFLSSGLIIILITLFTVGYHSLRAAFRNPVLSLRYE